MEKLLRVTQVSEALSIGKSTVWLYAKQGRLPKPIKLSERVSVWRESDIEVFVDSIVSGSANADDNLFKEGL